MLYLYVGIIYNGKHVLLEWHVIVSTISHLPDLGATGINNSELFF